MKLMPFPQHPKRRTEFDRFERDVISQQRFKHWTYGQQCLDPSTDTPAVFIDWLAYLVMKVIFNFDLFTDDDTSAFH